MSLPWHLLAALVAMALVMDIIIRVKKAARSYQPAPVTMSAKVIVLIAGTCACFIFVIDNLTSASVTKAAIYRDHVWLVVFANVFLTTILDLALIFLVFFVTSKLQSNGLTITAIIIVLYSASKRLISGVMMYRLAPEQVSVVNLLPNILETAAFCFVALHIYGLTRILFPPARGSANS